VFRTLNYDKLSSGRRAGENGGEAENIAYNDVYEGGLEIVFHKKGYGFMTEGGKSGESAGKTGY